MVELAQMAHFVDHDIVSQMFRQQRDPVIEIQITLARTAAPARALVTDGQTVEIYFIDLVELANLSQRQLARGFDVAFVIRAVSRRRNLRSTSL